MAGGRFNGDLVARFLDDGRVVELVNAFGYTDPDGLVWEAPAGARVDGASIPRALWSLIGGPFEGRYRNASVIHDWYCDRRSRPWKAVHRVFYNGMVTAGVDAVQAKVMYAGVYVGGPRWSETVIHNAGLDGGGLESLRRPGGDFAIESASTDLGADEPRTVLKTYRLAAPDAVFGQLAEQVRAGDLNLDEIDRLADRLAPDTGPAD